MACAICQTRREKRHCPGVNGEICAICCGEGREETVDCPLDCEYLQLAHQHESLAKDPEGMPYTDVSIPEGFIDKNYKLLLLFQIPILQAAIENKAFDSDVREALASLIQTYKTLGSGLYYESRPANPIAAAIVDGVQGRVAEIRKVEDERGLHKLQDNHILLLLVFLSQLAYALDNGRKKGRSFLANMAHMMDDAVADSPANPEDPSLIIS
jgi:hypothetical protein